jgi:hypothetical protein
MSRFRAVVAEQGTGIIRNARDPGQRVRRGQQTEKSMLFKDELSAMKYKDMVLAKYPELEVHVHDETWADVSTRFYLQNGQPVAEKL